MTQQPEQIDTRWKTIDGSRVVEGCWYKTKRNCLICVLKLNEDGTIIVESHLTANRIIVPQEQYVYFTLAEDPGTPSGVKLLESTESKVMGTVGGINRYNSLYDKYPHIIKNSIYTMQNINREGTPKWEKKREGKKTQIKGQVRCKITCQSPGCNNERDIKVQDAFQVKFCEQCKTKVKKENLAKLIADKSKEKSPAMPKSKPKKVKKAKKAKKVKK